jgi:Flp pilus assembly protein CpaB
MKSKNMTLMVVAIGCGLVAAFLTARLSGGSGPEMVDVWVAKKEITVGMILPADDKELEGFIVQTKMAKASLPPDVVFAKEDLKGKRVNRTMRQGNFFAPSDVGVDAGVKLPEGMRQYAIRTDVVRSASGFVEAGKKVDVLLTEAQPNGKKKSGIILQNMLVLTVDQHAKPQEGTGASGRNQVTSVSLAVTPKQAMLLSTAEGRGEVKLILRDENSVDLKEGLAVDKIEGFDDDGKNVQPPPQIPMVTVVVAKTDVPVNAFITSDNLTAYFTTREVPAKDVPQKSIRDLLTLREKYIVTPIQSELPVFSTMISESKGGKGVDTQVANATPQTKSPTDPPTMKPSGPEALPQPRAAIFPRKFVQFFDGKAHYWKEVAEGVYVPSNEAEIRHLPEAPTPEKTQPASERSA